jgi:hypothetical protein
MILRIFAASMLALVAGSIAERAKADQSFVCEDGSLVQVRAADLERMKRENACVAQYFGGIGTTAAGLPLPVRKPAVRAPEPTGVGIRTRRAEPDTPPENASPHRMVRIINAVEGESRWYRHSW